MRCPYCYTYLDTGFNCYNCQKHFGYNYDTGTLKEWINGELKSIGKEQQ